MAISNPVFVKITDALSPIFPIGAGSAVVTVCMQQGLDANSLSPSDLPVIKPLLVTYYKKFYEHKVGELQEAFKTL
jgi:hypothetical protein